MAFATLSSLGIASSRSERQATAARQHLCGLSRLRSCVIVAAVCGLLTGCAHQRRTGVAASKADSGGRPTHYETTVQRANFNAPSGRAPHGTADEQARERVSDDASAEDVMIPSRDIELVGTLRRPPAALAGERVSGVVLVAGSGPHTRAESMAGQLNMAFGFSIPVFDQLGDMLRDRGYAVLSYDKRTCGAFNRCATNPYPPPSPEITIDTLVDDVEATVEFLANRRDIDPRRIALVGHSQGAKLALEAMARDHRVSAAVMLAGNHRPIDALVNAQLEASRKRLRAANVSPDQLSRALTPISALYEQLKVARHGADGPGYAFLRSWIELDERAPDHITGLGRPVLALGGGYDWNVPPEEVRAWERTFERTHPNPGHQAEVIPCVTHALNCIDEPDATRLSPANIGKKVHAEVVERITAFFESAMASQSHERVR